MKTSTKLLSIMLGLMFIFTFAEVSAQRPRYGRHHHDHHRREVHHHDMYGHPGGRTVVYEFRQPRYVYYRDHNVYYDCHRNVYIVLSGNNWIFSTTVPLALARQNLSTLRRVDVDYYEDDLPRHLERRRSYSGW